MDVLVFSLELFDKGETKGHGALGNSHRLFRVAEDTGGFVEHDRALVDVDIPSSPESGTKIASGAR